MAIREVPLCDMIRPLDVNAVEFSGTDRKQKNCSNKDNVLKDEESLTNKIKSILYQWCSNSTSHGLPNIIRSRHILLKIMWIICFLISTSYCCYQIVLLLNDYFEYPVLVDMKVIHETPTEFPAVTICNLNPFNNVEGKQFIQKLLDERNVTQKSWLKENNQSTMQYSLSVLEMAKVELQKINSSDRERKKYGYQLEEMLISCRFSDTACNLNDFHWFFSYEYGNCYTFNSGFDNQHGQKTRTVSKSGINFGLDIELFCGNHDGLQEYAYKSGVIVAIHNQSIAADLEDDGIHVSVGFDTHILVKREFIYKLDKPYSDCVKNTTSFSEIDSFEFHTVFNITENNAYNQRYCIKLCYQKFIEDVCQCSDASLPRLNKRLERCNSAKEIKCVSDKRGHFYGTFLFDDCEKKCRMECESVKYKMTTSLARYPTKWYSEILKNGESVFPINLSNFTYEQMRESVAKVNIFYDDLAYDLLIEVAKINPETEIANLGGEFGLFIGISLLSFVEVFELVIEIFLAIYKHNRKNKLSS